MCDLCETYDSNNDKHSIDKDNGPIVSKENTSLTLDERIQQQIKQYIADPNTKVRIIYGSDSGECLYSVEVINSCGFWLDSFDTYEAALDYVHRNNLMLIVPGC